MNLEIAKAKLSNKLAEVREISDGVLLGVRRASDRDVAVYLFDFNDKVIESADRLSEYQDEVVGKSYFSTERSPDLRWNHYLYLVSGPHSRVSKRLADATKEVESDQTYARKFVIDETDLDKALENIDSVAEAAHPVQVSDITEIWSGKLVSCPANT